MQIKNALLLYKKSAYKVYFLEKGSSLFRRQAILNSHELRDFKEAHEEHYRTLRYIEQILLKEKIDRKSVV